MVYLPLLMLYGHWKNCSIALVCSSWRTKLEKIWMFYFKSAFFFSNFWTFSCSWWPGALFMFTKSTLWPLRNKPLPLFICWIPLVDVKYSSRNWIECGKNCKVKNYILWSQILQSQLLQANALLDWLWGVAKKKIVSGRWYYWSWRDLRLDPNWHGTPTICTDSNYSRQLNPLCCPPIVKSKTA